MGLVVNQSTVKWISRALWPLLCAAGEKTKWHERWQPTPPQMPVDLWIHTASVGEISSLVNLISSHDKRIGITVTSGRSFTAVQQKFQGLADVRPLPIPQGPGFAQLLAAWQPKRLLLLEAEAWPAMLAAVPKPIGELAVLGGRMRFATSRAWRNYFASPSRAAAFVGAWVEGPAQAQQFAAVGCPVDKIHSGYLAKLVNIQPAKVDPLYELWRQDGGPHVVAGSMHPNEISILAAAWTMVIQKQPTAKLFVAPRYPEQTVRVAAKLKAAGLDSNIWPQQGPITLIDQFGVLAGLYSLADAAIVGGSFNGKGGHNPVEAIVHGIGVVMGPSITNQRAIIAAAGEQVAIVTNASDLAKKILAYAGRSRFPQAPFAQFTSQMISMAKAALG